MLAGTPWPPCRPTWLHQNSLEYDPHDDSIIFSARYQGVAKITRNGTHGPTPNKGKRLVWILAPHMGWGMGGWDGMGTFDPNTALLTAIDAMGVAYAPDVQNNLIAPDSALDEFHWPVGQHGLRVTSRTGDRITLLNFNNQASFVFDGVGSVNNGSSPFHQGDLSNDRSNPSYSMFTEYEIDENSKTVRQVWGHGQGEHTYYGSLNCGVNLLSNNNKVMISSGYDSHDPFENPSNPHVLEFSEVGDLLLHLEVRDMSWLAYNGGKVDLFHPER